MEGEWTIDKPFIIMTSERPLSEEEREARNRTTKRMKIIPFFTSLPETNLYPKRTEPQIIDLSESYLKGDEMEIRNEIYFSDWPVMVEVLPDGSDF